MPRANIDIVDKISDENVFLIIFSVLTTYKLLKYLFFSIELNIWIAKQAQKSDKNDINRRILNLCIIIGILLNWITPLISLIISFLMAPLEVIELVA